MEACHRLAEDGELRLPARTRLNLDVIGTLATRTDVAWKFVIDDVGDIEEAESIVDDLGLDEVILVPQSTTAEAVLEQLRWLVP